MLRFRHALSLFVVALFVNFVGPRASAALIPNPIRGVTVDGISPLKKIVTSLQRLSRKPTTRLVFDEFVPASTYVTPAVAIHKVSYLMGELLDSSAFKQYDLPTYTSRVNEYLNALSGVVDIWEVGNEVNGEWLGDTPSVVAKISSAYDLVKARGQTTELTLYFNQDCWQNPANEMFRWASTNLPERMRLGLDYVLISWYEDDCNNLQPDWTTVFNRLATMFPNSRLGFGEVGASIAAHKAPYIRKYYGLKLNVPRYVGGYFWWYFREDMVPYTKSLWSVLNTAFSAMADQPALR